MQWIHWKSSARRGELTVREFDAAPSPELLLVVEPWLPESPSAHDKARLEGALSIAASIFRAWCLALETKATLVVAGDPCIVKSGHPSASFARSALVPLADVAGRARVPPPPPSAFGAALRRSARLVVSSRSGSEFADGLTRSTGKPFAQIGPSTAPEWYVPPPGAG